MFRRDFDSFTGLREIGREIEKNAEIDEAFKPPPGASKTREEDKSSRKDREAISAVSDKSEKKSKKQQKSDAAGKNAKRSDDEKPKKKKSLSRRGKRGKSIRRSSGSTSDSSSGSDSSRESHKTSSKRSSRRHSDKGSRKESSSHSGHRSSSSDELGAIAAAPKQGQRRPNSSSRAPGGHRYAIVVEEEDTMRESVLRVSRLKPRARDYACTLVDSTSRRDASANAPANGDHTRAVLYSSAVATNNECEKSGKRAVGLAEEVRAGPTNSLRASGRTVRIIDPKPLRDSSMSNTDYEDYASESDQIDLRDSSTSNSEDESVVVARGFL
ncbi:uncharacterized protein [Prorops nasuta]|uniref:uncharacterized protein n=1 Tax=Prorops nasuta TaxID=863751 RepID=UPI0034CDA353